MTSPRSARFAIRVADDALARAPADRWAYEWAVLLGGVAWVWRATGDARYLACVERHIGARQQH